MTSHISLMQCTRVAQKSYYKGSNFLDFNFFMNGNSEQKVTLKSYSWLWFYVNNYHGILACLFAAYTYTHLTCKHIVNNPIVSHTDELEGACRWVSPCCRDIELECVYQPVYNVFTSNRYTLQIGIDMPRSPWCRTYLLAVFCGKWKFS